jgi:hypothetical protein
MVYGDDADFPLADDVVAHELTHGVTEYESGLFYYYQSGAINESLSDVFGEFLDLTYSGGTDTAGTRWLMGEDIEPGATGALRDMEDPTVFGDPDKMTSANYFSVSGDLPEGSFDNGGVHFNSGVNNKAAFLMVDGATFNGKTVTGLGITKTANIYYYAATNLLTSGADYLDLYHALRQACAVQIGVVGITAGDCAEVQDALDAVEMNLQPVAGYNPEAPYCPTGKGVGPTLFFDNFEDGFGNWDVAALTGASRWFGSSFFAHSGAAHLWADANAPVNSDSVAAMDTSYPIVADTYLHFAHAFGWQQPADDGGLVEYSTNGGGSWSDAGGLFDENGYTGTISDDPLSGLSAFVGDSHGYISTRLNLTSLAGQSVRFRFRQGIDSTGVDLGWVVDDVRIYTCVTPAAPTGITITPPGSTFSGVAALLNAAILPVTTTTPMTYTWEASGQTTIIHASELELADAVMFTWPVSGTQVVTVTATNGLAVVSDTVSITVTQSSGAIYLPLISKNWPPAAGAWQNIVTEGFEGDFPIGAWTVSDPGFGEFFWAKRDCKAATGSYSAWAMGGGSEGGAQGCGANYINGSNAWMIYGPFSLADATAAELALKLWLNSEAGFDLACLIASTNGEDFSGDCHSGTSDNAFVSASLDLTNVHLLGDLRGAASVWVAVLFDSDASVNLVEGAHVDDIVLRKCVGGACASAASQSAPGLTLTHAAFDLSIPPAR